MLNVNAMKEYRKRYETVAEIHRSELQQMTIADRWHKLNLLMRTVMALGWRQKMLESDRGVDSVRARWTKLKVNYK